MWVIRGFTFSLFQDECYNAHFCFVVGVLYVLMFSSGWSCPHIYIFDAVANVMSGCLVKTTPMLILTNFNS
jgi:hypothetical protein